MQRLPVLFAEYDVCHQTRGNKVCHWIGIPLILVSLFGFLGTVKLGPSDLGGVVLLAMIVYWAALDWRLALLMTLAGVGLYVSGSLLPIWALVGLQAVGWILQFVGHYAFEHKSPAFMRNIPHLLVGPLYFVNDIVKLVPLAVESEAS